MSSSTDLISFWLLNLSSAFFCSAAHNALFYLFGITTCTTHFLHYATIFVLLLVGTRCGLIGAPHRLPIVDLLPSAIAQLCITLATSVVHSHRRDGTLYLLRLTDWMSTAIVLIWTNDRRPLLLIAFASSFSWLEFGIIEYDAIGLFFAPIVGIAQAVHVMQTYRLAQQYAGVCQLEVVIMNLAGLISIMTMLPAIVAAYFSYVETSSASAALESIDHLLLSMSLIFMCAQSYSKYWLMMTQTPIDYLLLRHGKYTLASMGQWYTQNMAHATVYSVCAKLVAIVGSIRYLLLIGGNKRRRC